MSKFIDDIENVKALQTALQIRGYDIGPDGVDGILGNASRWAIIKYREDNKLGNKPGQTLIDDKLLMSLGLRQKRGLEVMKVFLPIFLSLITKGQLPMLTKDQVQGLIQIVLGIISGWAIGKGIGDAAWWETMSGGVVTVGVSLWALWFNHPTQIIASAEALKK